MVRPATLTAVMCLVAVSPLGSCRKPPVGGIVLPVGQEGCVHRAYAPLATPCPSIRAGISDVNPPHALWIPDDYISCRPVTGDGTAGPATAVAVIWAGGSRGSLECHAERDGCALDLKVWFRNKNLTVAVGDIESRCRDGVSPPD
jgi:hypothetical protein